MSTIERSDSETTRAIVERFYGSVADGDFDTWAALLADDIELHEPPVLPYGGVYRGKDTIVELSARLGTLVDFSSITSEGLFVDGDRALSMMSSRTTDGEPVLAIEEVLVRDGQVVRVRVFFHDPTPMANAAVAAGIS